MKNELKRALFKKSNIFLIIGIIILMFINSYYAGWKTALTAAKATDIANMEDVIFYQKYFGNVYRVWSQSYYAIQTLSPLVLVTPYMLTYTMEKFNKYRYLTISRQGKMKYILSKIFTIALSGTIVLGSAECLFGIISYMFTQHDTSLEFISGIVSFKTNYFYEEPLKYFIFVYISHIIFYFSFLFFATGITAFFKNKIAITIIPFLAMTILDMILPLSMKPNVLMKPHISANFSMGSFFMMMTLYIILGVILVYISEKIYLKRGN